VRIDTSFNDSRGMIDYQTILYSNFDDSVREKLMLRDVKVKIVFVYIKSGYLDLINEGES
jgi:hypothetical protein